MKVKYFYLFILGLLLVISPIILLKYNVKEINKEGLCVDGHGDINLEGLKCDKSYSSIFGVDKEDTIIITMILLFIFLLGAVIIYFSLTKLNYFGRK